MTTKKNSINIDIKFISDKIDKYIEEFCISEHRVFIT